MAELEKADKQDEVAKVKTGRVLGIVSLIIGSVALLVSFGALGIAGLAFINSEGQSHHWQGGFFDGNNMSLEPNTVENVVEQVGRSVVSIQTETRTQGMFGGSAMTGSSGTGMIVTSDGYILTNKHVVAGATRIRVVLESGDVFEAEFVGEDPLNDVAFIRINTGFDLPAVEFGNSRTLRVGQPVIAIGNALGQYQNTVTMGVISGLSRSIIASDGIGQSERLTDMIQTDAAINSGNSGGPLVNAAGQVIGINTAVSTNANGLGFAIPIGMVQGMLRTLLDTGRTERAFLGVFFQEITPELAADEGLPVRRGAWITSPEGGSAIVSGSPADRAGLREGDIIVKVGGEEVGLTGSLSALLAEYPVGRTVELEVLRDGNTTVLSLRLEAHSQ